MKNGDEYFSEDDFDDVHPLDKAPSKLAAHIANEQLKGKVVVDESDLVKVYAETLCPGTDWSSSMWDEGTHEAYLIKSSIREIKKCEHLPGKFIWNFTEGTEISHVCVKCCKKIEPSGWKEV